MMREGPRQFQRARREFTRTADSQIYDLVQYILDLVPCIEELPCLFSGGISSAVQEIKVYDLQSEAVVAQRLVCVATKTYFAAVIRNASKLVADRYLW